MDVMERYRHWLSMLKESDPLRGELLAIESDEKEIRDRFYQDIEFGTAGLRGICGAGTNRMNDLTVGRATAGIAAYCLASGEDVSRGVVIAYDCRYHSREFSELAAEIFAAQGIPVFLFPSLRPTPELSFAIRKLHALSGVNLTASHNPKEYNGYKVYWEDGAQISGEVSDGMTREINRLDYFDPIPRISLTDAIAKGLVHMLGEEMDGVYLAYVQSMAQRPDAELDLAVPVVYTPLNGAGSIPMKRIAEMRGFTAFSVVAEQEAPDPDFTTVPFPNPENPEAFGYAETLGNEKTAELLIATDPDADRMAAEIRRPDGTYLALNGNQTGAMLIAYLAESQKERETLPEHAAMIKSIVTGDFGRKICESYGIRVYEALTGFKNICGRIPDLERNGETYFFGYEESIGCAPGEAVRDKDGIAAGMLLMEMAAWCKKNGSSLYDYQESLYESFGYFAETQVSFILKGEEGKARIGRIMDAFRSQGAELIRSTAREENTAGTDGDACGGMPEIARVVDYLHGYEDIPASNVLKFVLSDGSWFAMRPSGTEPKLKFYYYAVSDAREKANARIAQMKERVNAVVEAVE